MFSQEIFAGMMLPFIGTAAGAVLVMAADRLFHSRTLSALHALAAGVMTAASVFSLLLPAIQLSPASVPWLPAVTGFLLGGFCLFLLEKMLSDLSAKKDGSMMMLAVTLHNFPEGMAVGAALAGLSVSGVVTLPAALITALGISIQNIPEGAIIYAPMYARGDSRKKAFLGSVFSGAVEPIGALITFFFTSFFTPLLPYILSLAAGAMIYVVADEMIPSAKEGNASAFPTLIYLSGFALMLLLDVAFS